MTADELARLLHETSRQWREGRGHGDSTGSWDDLNDWRRAEYRHVAAVVLGTLGADVPLVVTKGEGDG